MQLSGKDEKMLDRLNTLGLPVKYGLIGFLGCPAGLFLANMLGISSGGTSYFMASIAGGIGGAVGGLLSKRRGTKT
jgi:hypothetical protein